MGSGGDLTKRRLDTRLTERLTEAARARYEEAVALAPGDSLFSSWLYPRAAAHDLFRLLEFKWSRIEPEAKDENRGYSCLSRPVGIR